MAAAVVLHSSRIRPALPRWPRVVCASAARLPGYALLRLAAPGCAWLRLTAPGCAWLRLAAPGLRLGCAWSSRVPPAPSNLHYGISGRTHIRSARRHSNVISAPPRRGICAFAPPGTISMSPRCPCAQEDCAFAPACCYFAPLYNFCPRSRAPYGSCCP